MYNVVDILFKAGDQVPLTLFKEVVGSGAKVSPEHIGGIALNVGTTLGIIVIVNVTVLAHCPAVGVKVYVVVAELSIAGDHEPVTLFVDVVGNGAIASPLHTGSTALNNGTILEFTFMVKLAELAH